VAAWARLTEQALRAEYEDLGPAEMLPLALRAAPPGMDAADSLDETLDALVAPIRSGFVLSYRDLANCAHQVGLGLRRGERRYALRAMLEQDAPGTLSWLGARARWWAEQRSSAPPTTNDPCAWWSRRAANSATVLEALVAERTD
jgi:hypothetical protein